MSALSGFRVLELCESVSGEYCGKLLADFGAEIIKIEKPGCGSPTRQLAPFASTASTKNAAGDNDIERSGLFAYLNTNKHSLTLDVTTPAGLATLGKLLERVDVVIDDHSVEWLNHVGIDLNHIEKKIPRLIVCSITAFGLTPPDDRKHAEDLTVFHSSGWGYHTPSGEQNKPPLKGAGRFLTSYEAGLEAALCIVAALYERERSALGRVIEVSKQEVLASRIDYVLGQMIAGDMDVSTSRTQFDLSGPSGFFTCNDGYAYMWISAPGHWEALRKLLENPEWMNSFPERWLERECTPERVAQCRHHVSEWLKTQNKHEVAEAAQKLGLTLVAVNNAKDLIESEQYQFRNFFAEVTHPVLGAVQYPTVPYQLSETPTQIKSAAPLLGQHDRKYLADIGGQP